MFYNIPLWKFEYYCFPIQQMSIMQDKVLPQQTSKSSYRYLVQLSAGHF